MEAGLGAGGGQQIGQIDWIALLQVRKLLVLPALRDHPGNVAAGASTETGIAPATDEESTGTITVDVGYPSALDEVFLFLSKTGAIRRNAMNEQLTTPPVAHHRDVVVLLRPSRFVEEHRPGAGTTAHVNEGGNDFASVTLEELGVTIFARLNLVNEAHIPTAAIIGVAAGVHVHEGINRDVVDIAQPMGIRLEFGAVGAHPYHPTAVHGKLGAVGALGVDETEVADGNVDPSIDSHANSIGRMVHPAGLIEFSTTDLLDQMLGWTIRLAVAVRIGKHGEEHTLEFLALTPLGVENIKLVAHRHDATRVVDHGIDRVGFRHAVVIGVNQANDLSLAATLAERADLIDAGVDFTGGSHSDAGNAGSKGIWRKQSGLELFGNGDVSSPPFLGISKCRHEHGGKKREKRSKTFHKAKSMSKGKKPWRELECNATFFPLSGINRLKTARFD